MDRRSSGKRRGHQFHPKNVISRRRLDAAVGREPTQCGPADTELSLCSQLPPEPIAALPLAEPSRPNLPCARNTKVKSGLGNDDPGPEHAVARARGDGNSDNEEDPELAEFAKLRCSSERAEVQAEREARRRKRCADYPGLAFGCSIFSSDTMMKFNLIKNELQNIKLNQLKRVSAAFSGFFARNLKLPRAMSVAYALPFLEFSP